MNANIVIPENLVVLNLAKLVNLGFSFFFLLLYHSYSFNRITVFYRDRIIENDRKYILNGNKYIASI